MFKKILLSILASLLLSLSAPRVVVAIEEFSGVGACDYQNPVSLNVSRPAPVNACDAGYLHSADSCSNPFAITKKIKIQRNDGPCVQEQWTARIGIDLSAAEVPFFGKNGQEDTSKYLADYLEGVQGIYKNFSDEQTIEQQTGVVQRLFPEEWQCTQRMIQIQMHCDFDPVEIHDYELTNGVDKGLLSDFCQNRPPECASLEYSDWKLTKAGRLFQTIPLTSREDTGNNYMKIVANLRSSTDSLQVVNANNGPVGVEFPLPQVARLARLTQLVRAAVLPFADYKADDEEENSESLNLDSLEYAGNENDTPVFRVNTSPRTQKDTCDNLAPLPVIDDCDKQGVPDDKKGDNFLCDDDICQPKERYTVYVDIKATDKFTNPKYLPCEPELICDNPILCPNPDEHGCCLVPSNPECEDEVEITVYRRIKPTFSFQWLPQSWMNLCQEKPSNVYLFNGFLRGLYPQEWQSNICKPYYGVTNVGYSCLGDDCTTVPSSGLIYLPNTAGIDMAIKGDLWNLLKLETN